METLHNAEREIVLIANNYRQQVTWPKNRRVILSGDIVFRAYQQIPSIVTALVDLQNQSTEIIRLVAKVPGSLPNSFNKWQKNGFNGAAEAERKILQNYWQEKNGKYIRDLRDVLEHHDMLGYVSFWDGKSNPGMFLIFMPDNPEDKKPTEFTYVKENDAFEVLRDGLDNIHKMLDDVCLLNGIEKMPHRAAINLDHAGKLVGGEERTLGLLMEGLPKTSHDGRTELKLSTTEIMQIVPNTPGGGNVALRKLLLDSEVDQKA